jgi:hypothetical protein
MQKTRRTNETLWKRIQKRVLQQEVAGTKAGQWSARKAQLAVRLYKEKGGKYKGPKTRSNALDRWTRQKWRTKSGKPSHETGERYLPSSAIEKLTPEEYARTTQAKRKAMKEGRQFSSQPSDIALKVKPEREKS